VGDEGARSRGGRADRGQQSGGRPRRPEERPRSSSTSLPTSACRSSAPGASATSRISSALSGWATPPCRWAPAFIATTECTAHADYKRAIVEAHADDVVLTERITGVPVSVIRTPYIEKTGTKAGPLARWMLKGRKTKHWMRTIYALQSLWKLKRSSVRSFSYRDYLQAGKSVEGIGKVEPAGEIVRRFKAAAEEVAWQKAETGT